MSYSEDITKYESVDGKKNNSNRPASWQTFGRLECC